MGSWNSSVGRAASRCSTTGGRSSSSAVAVRPLAYRDRTAASVPAEALMGQSTGLATAPGDHHIYVQGGPQLRRSMLTASLALAAVTAVGAPGRVAVCP